jgi:hypothetical protein
MCLTEGRGPVRATCADHIAPHRGDFVKFQMGDARRYTLPHSSRKARAEYQAPKFSNERLTRMVEPSTNVSRSIEASWG